MRGIVGGWHAEGHYTRSLTVSYMPQEEGDPRKSNASRQLFSNLVIVIASARLLSGTAHHLSTGVPETTKHTPWSAI